MPGSRVTALGHHQPARVLTNTDLEQLVDTSDEWIRRRTGIVTRHLADGSVTDLATEAAAKALATAGPEPRDIEMVIVATCSAIDRCPSIAAQVAGRLGVPAAVCFDLNNGCAGFCTALATADHAVRAGTVRHALVLAAEKMSDVTDWTDRGTCVLLGDGAGAAVVSAADQAGVGPVVWGSDPAHGNLVRLVDAWQPRFAQDGQAVFRWATGRLPEVATEACRRAGIATTDLAGVVPHQANLRIVEAIVARLDLRDDVVIGRDVVDSGNTSAASVPLALSKLVARGDLPPGEPVLLFAFGGGLSWAAQVITCP